MNEKQIRILIVDDDEIVRESLREWLEEEGYTIDTAENATAALTRIGETRYDLHFVDIKMPGMDGLELQRRILKQYPEALVIIITAYAAVDTAVTALKEGAFDYVTKPFDPDALTHLIRNAIRQRALQRENVQLKEALDTYTSLPEIVGSGKHISALQDDIRTVAPTATTIMIRGESGTGKELVAQAIHLLSPRRLAPLVSVNCGAFPETLLESELFGHERGAFTGAMYRRKGKLELADGGSLFLDEIGAVQPKTQVELLRAIETREFTRLGGSEPVHSDFRIICATNADLEEMVEKHQFREDLYYRLQVYVINLLPLRERKEDIPELVRHFLRLYGQKMNKRVHDIAPDAMDLLMQHQWPGNIRELENTIERAMVMTQGEMLLRKDFLLSSAPKQETFATELSMSQVERRHILNVLESTDWNITQAARILDMDRSTVYAKMEKFGILRP